MIDYGYNQSEICWGDSVNDEATVRRVCEGIRDIGGSRVRVAVQIGTWDDLDRAVNIARENGLKPLLCIINNPQFGYDGTPAGYAAMCKAIALRYGPSGTGQVTEYELFNEENSSLNAPGVGNATAFTQYLKSGYTAIKSVHSSAMVLCGGTIPAPDTWVPFLGVATNPLEWYQGIYAAGGKDYMDALGFHLYADVPPTPQMTQWKYLTDLRDLMVAQGDSDKKIWVTEVGAGFPAPGVQSLTMARDWLKIMVEAIESYDYCGPFFIYNYRNCTTNTGDPNSVYGMVNNDFTPKSPVFEYAQTIAGTPSNPLDIVPPSPPANFRVTVTGSQSAIGEWDPATDDVGVTVYRIYDSADNSILAHTVQLGQVSSPIFGLVPGTPYTAYATAIDAAGNESLPSNTFPFTTDAPSGTQEFFSFDFLDSPGTPPVFSQLGLGCASSLGLGALPNVPTSDGDYYTIAPYIRDQASPDHYSEITQESASAYNDRYALAIIRVSPDGAQWVAALVSGGESGQDDAAQIITRDGGFITLRAAENATPLLASEKLRITASGNTYTAHRISGASSSELVTWTDLDGSYTGATNVRAGVGWRHKRVGGVYYPPVPIANWKSADLMASTSTPATPGGGSSLWELAISKPSRLGLVYSTGLWQAAL